MAVTMDFDDEKTSAKSDKKADEIYEGETGDGNYTGNSDDVYADNQGYGDWDQGSLSDDPFSGDFHGNFSLIYNVSNHQGIQHFYEGDAKNENLVLQVTEEQWQQSWLQTAIADFEEFLNRARPGDIFDFSIYDHAGQYLQLKAANFQAVLIELLTGGSRSSSEEDSVSDGDVTA